MFKKGEKIFAVTLLAVCVLIGIVGYSFSGDSTAPDKIWFDSAGGDVILDHVYHVEVAECEDCHHNIEEDSKPEDAELDCRVCHYYGEKPEEESEDETHKRFIGAQCIECHEGAELEMKCDTCHILKGFAYKEWVREMPEIDE